MLKRVVLGLLVLLPIGVTSFLTGILFDAKFARADAVMIFGIAFTVVVLVNAWLVLAVIFSPGFFNHPIRAFGAIGICCGFVLGVSSYKSILGDSEVGLPELALTWSAVLTMIHFGFRLNRSQSRSH